MDYLLDTDIAVFLLRGRHGGRHAEVAERIARRGRTADANGHRVALSAITLAELEFGARRSRDYATEVAVIRQGLKSFSILDFPVAGATEHYGRIRHELEAAGTKIGEADLFIAAHALALGAVMATNNRREFSRVKGLTCENWSEA